MSSSMMKQKNSDDDDDDSGNADKLPTRRSHCSQLCKINANEFYEEYHGHKLQHLKLLYPALRHRRGTSDNSETTSTTNIIIWTAGDSSLDNKYWFNDCRPAVANGYSEVLHPPVMKCDVTFWLNYLSREEHKGNRRLRRQRPSQQSQSSEITTTSANISPNNNSRSRLLDSHQNDGSNSNNNSTAFFSNSHDRPFSSSPALSSSSWSAINTAVEATTLNERTFRLLPQDMFIRNNIQSQDILVVSVGGNDVAMAPTPCTISSILGYLWCCRSQQKQPSSSCTCCVVPYQDYACGCGGSSVASCCGTWPPCLGYLRHLFQIRTELYIKKLVAKIKPKLVLVCMIYFPDISSDQPSWANAALKALGYDSNPKNVQHMIREVFEVATSRISIEGTKVIPVPLYEVLDGTIREDYVARVEPSATGGRKMARYLLDVIDEHYA